MSPNQKPLATMEDEFEVPKEVQDAADSYVKTMTAKSKANEKFNAARDQLIAVMKEHELLRVRVLYKSTEKIVELEDTNKISLKKPKKESEGAEDDEE